MNDNLKISIICVDDFSSNIIFSKICKNKNITSINLETKYSNKSSNKFLSVVKLLFNMSKVYFFFLFFKNFFFKFYEFLLRKGFFKNKQIYSLKEIARKNKIKVRFENLNQSLIKKIIKESPDIIIIRCSTILSRELIKIPKYGIWCLHSSLLPACKGIAGEFHSIIDNIPIGFSLFKIEEKIDQSNIVFSNSINIKKEDSLFKIIYKNNISASNYLIRFINKKIYLKKFNKIKNKFGSSYYSWPNSHNVKIFLNKRKLFRFNDLLLFRR